MWEQHGDDMVLRALCTPAFTSATESTNLASQRPGAGLLGVQIDDPTVDIRIKLSFCQEHTNITVAGVSKTTFIF